jgi:cob(I)alamin adenosyltransferase
MRIYTRSGDDGDTALFGGGRVHKDSLRVDAYGDIDELNASIGLARAAAALPGIDELLVPIQRDLFGLGALLATPNQEKMKQQLEKARIDEDRIAQLEHSIDAAESQLEPIRAFVLPGGTPKAAALHLARTICRRAERKVVRLSHEEEIPLITIRYLNRLSDLLFVLARLAAHLENAGEVTW